MAVTTAAVVGFAASAGGAVQSFSQAAKQGRMAEDAATASKKAMAEAKAKAEKNFYAGLNVSTEAYDKSFENNLATQQQNIQAQSQANAQAQQVAAQAEVQKQQSLIQINSQLEQLKAQLESQKMQQEVFAKKELMQLEFQYNLQLKQMETSGIQNREKEKEDRKDERTKIQASQQSELIDQRKKEKPPKNFESSGNDILSGNFNLGGFDPK